MTEEETDTGNFGRVFDYRALRLLMGLIALSLSPIVWYKAGEQLGSISAYYHSGAHDLFVGLLFVVAAFLWAYNGRTIWQGRMSKIAGLAAILVATYPTACDGPCTKEEARFECGQQNEFTSQASTCRLCEICQPAACCRPAWVSVVHYVSAGTLFSILAYFCIFPFRRYDKEEEKTAKKERRRKIYWLCGLTMIGCMLVATVSNFAAPGFADKLRITFWSEAIALSAFGIAWIVAGKWIPSLVDEDERLYLRKKLSDNVP